MKSNLSTSAFLSLGINKENIKYDLKKNFEDNVDCEGYLITEESLNHIEVEIRLHIENEHMPTLRRVIKANRMAQLIMNCGYLGVCDISFTFVDDALLVRFYNIWSGSHDT
jgi:uncharacterized protein (DUF111 family)